MAQKSGAFFIIVLLTIFVASISYKASAALGGGKGNLVGGWKPIQNLKDPQVVEIAKFAVAEHNQKTKAALVYKALVKAESQVVSGTNYKLVISAKDGSVSNNYEAVVWDKPWLKFRQLTSFDKIN
ncbi:hypothetical protein ACJIZ3_012830 [Penstemon smallii]|uniref:Cystatin domain-containing protein n=1 Tax=Penstemon smallii TaxID=265156 RepID=A0ABD3URD1_9LAMI